MFEQVGKYYIVCYWENWCSASSAPIGQLAKTYQEERVEDMKHYVGRKVAHTW